MSSIIIVPYAASCESSCDFEVNCITGYLWQYPDNISSCYTFDEALGEVKVKLLVMTVSKFAAEQTFKWCLNPAFSLQLPALPMFRMPLSTYTPWCESLGRPGLRRRWQNTGGIRPESSTQYSTLMTWMMTCHPRRLRSVGNRFNVKFRSPLQSIQKAVLKRFCEIFCNIAYSPPPTFFFFFFSLTIRYPFYHSQRHVLIFSQGVWCTR